jgi:hypothetical protein
MKSFINFLTEARPKGQKRYQRDTSKLETRLDKMYAAGGSQKKIDRAEMRLARRTNEGDYDIDDQMLPSLKSNPHLQDENNPRSQSLEELMRDAARKMHTDGYTHEMVGAEIRSAMGDMLHIPHDVQPGVTDKDLGQEAHRMLLSHNALVKRIKNKKK